MIKKWEGDLESLNTYCKVQRRRTREHNGSKRDNYSEPERPVSKKTGEKMSQR